MKDCIFCKIIEEKIPGVKIWEDESHIAILDVNPINPGHVLLIPRKHNDYVFDLSDDEYSQLMLKAKDLSKDMKIKLKPKRIGMAIEGFGVPHVHIHLVPINKADELNPKRARRMDPRELKEIADKLRK
ncbi:MAG: HIT family protein [Nanoarchaeota archaeon]|nr:HIT family protein [Nanoarchaeota archaeon]